MAETQPGTSTVDRVMLILRRDLMLGPDVTIDEDAPLFGGDEIDLDSLDALLLVTSIEKEFGIKIANKAIGEQIFRSVRTLALYIDQAGTKLAADEVTP